MVHEIKSKEDFDEQLKEAGKKLVVVDFYANWCGPCKRIAPFIEDLAGKHGDKVVFLKVNVDDVDELVSTYSVQSMPTFLYIREKKVIDTLVGANQDKLEGMINTHLA